MYRVSPELHTPLGLGPWGLTLQFNELSGTVTRMSGPGSRAGPGDLACLFLEIPPFPVPRFPEAPPPLGEGGWEAGACALGSAPLPIPV